MRQWNWDSVVSPLKCSPRVFSVISDLTYSIALHGVAVCDNAGMVAPVYHNSWHIIVLQFVYNWKTCEYEITYLKTTIPFESGSDDVSFFAGRFEPIFNII